MPTKGKPAIPSTIRSLEHTSSEHVYYANYTYARFRVMFDGGDTVDVMAITADSDLRKAILDTVRRPDGINRYDGIIAIALVETIVESDE